MNRNSRFKCKIFFLQTMMEVRKMLFSDESFGSQKNIFQRPVRMHNQVRDKAGVLKQVFLLLALLAMPAIVYGQGNIHVAPHPLYEPELEHAVELMLSMRLDSAETRLDKWIGSHPGDPSGLFMRSALFSWRLFLLPEEDDSGPLTAAFEKANEMCRESAEHRLKERGGEFEGTVYLGAVYGQEALLALIDRRHLAMAPLAKKAWKYVQRAVSLDPQYYDNYLGLGIYLYFTDVLPRLVKVLAEAYGFEGDRVRGLASLHLAAKRGMYSRDAARIMLVNIYSEIESPDSTIVSIARDLALRYPDNPLVQWRLGDILLRSREYEGAEEIFRSVLERVDSGRPFYRNRMFTRWSMLYRIGICQRKSNRREEARRTFESVISAGEIKPEWIPVEARLQAGELYILAGDTARASQKLREAVRMKDFRDSRKRAESLLREIEK